MTTPKKPEAAKPDHTKHPSVPPSEPVKRRDATGHLDPKYAAELRARSLETPKDDDRAFLSGPRTGEQLAENFGEEFVASATSGESEAERSSSEDVTADEVGGPFVITNGGTEFARGTDKSNPKTATREPFPKT